MEIGYYPGLSDLTRAINKIKSKQLFKNQFDQNI